MKIKMQLLSDTILGNGMSVPGGEDISVLHDEDGFPYYKASTFKGIFREELVRLLEWKGLEEKEIQKKVIEFLGTPGSDIIDKRKLIFSDFTLSDVVRKNIKDEIGDNQYDILNALSHIRTFTSINEDGVVKTGSLRNCRCVNKGIYLYSEIIHPEDETTIELVKETLGLIKWIGSMKNRGFGKVKISIEG